MDENTSGDDSSHGENTSSILVGVTNIFCRCLPSPGRRWRMDQSFPAGSHKYSFPPVVDGRTQVLVLGSLPGERSLAAARYYAHPRNHFWPLVGEVVELDLLDMPYEQRLKALLARGVGLWDVVGSAVRTGSLDAAIKDPRANDLASLADGLPQLRAIGFNGAKAADIGAKLLAGRRDLALIGLPSSSPAYTVPYASKRAAWVKLGQYLADVTGGPKSNG